MICHTKLLQEDDELSGPIASAVTPAKPWINPFECRRSTKFVWALRAPKFVCTIQQVSLNLNTFIVESAAVFLSVSLCGGSGVVRLRSS